MVKIEATVERCGHNKRLVSARMVEAEAHVMRFIGDNGEEFIGPSGIYEMLEDLMRLGHEFTVRTIYHDVPMSEFVHGCEEFERA